MKAATPVSSHWDADWSASSYVYLSLVALPRLAWIVLVVLTLLWVVQVEGSFGFNLNSTFGWHAFFMILATICVGESILAVSKSPSPYTRYSWLSGRQVVAGVKVGVIKHIGFHLASVVLVILALVAIGYYKQQNVTVSGATFPFWTLFSPHSWLGLVLMMMWLLQVTVRAIQARVLSAAAKLVSHRTHVFLGKAVFVTALATCALGFQDMQGSDLSVDVDDMAYQPQSVWANYACAAVIMLLVYGVAVLGLSDMGRGIESSVSASKSASSPHTGHVLSSPSSSHAEFSEVSTHTVEIQ